MFATIAGLAFDRIWLSLDRNGTPLDCYHSHEVITTASLAMETRRMKMALKGGSLDFQGTSRYIVAPCTAVVNQKDLCSELARVFGSPGRWRHVKRQFLYKSSSLS